MKRFVVAFALLFAFALLGCSGGAQSGTEAGSSEKQDASAASTESDSEASSKQRKDGFDEITNSTIEVAGVEFSAPAYYEVQEGNSDNQQQLIVPDDNQVGILTRVDDTSSVGLTQNQFDSSVKDMMVEEIIGDSVLSVAQSKDGEIANLSARIVSLEGVSDGVEKTGYLIIFFNEESSKLGSIIFVQTANAQYDYSDDFASMLKSAKLVASSDDQVEQATEETETQDSDKQKKESGEVDPELKEWLDSYEAVVDSYVSFMEQYDPNDLSSMSQYLDLLQQYSEFAQQVDDLDTSNMSAADYAYYIEVTSRCSEKLLSVSYDML